MLLLTIAIVLLLYLRTLNYNYVIDDYVKRDGYLYDIPMEGPHPDFWKKKPSPWYRLFMIGMHCVNTSVIYLLWGWGPALLFAVHPLSVWGTAWVTGNYYATTAYFVLISYYFVHTLPHYWGTLMALPFYTAALNSTITALAFPFLMIPNVAFFFPLIMFLRGKRFRVGTTIRKQFGFPTKVDVKFTPRRFFLMTKVMARYIYVILVPDRLGFFPAFGKDIRNSRIYYNRMHSADAEFWSAFALCLTVLVAGLMINPFATMWFFIFMGLHSQFKIMGQFFAQRYCYLPMIGLCVVAGTVLQGHPILMTVAVTALVIRTHFFIPAWRNMETVWRNDIDMFPDNAGTYSNAAQYLLENKRGLKYQVLEAGYLLFKAYTIEPTSYEVNMNLAVYHYYVGHIPWAIHYTDKALTLVTELGIENRIKDLTEQKQRLEKTQNERANLSRSTKGEDNGKRTEETAVCIQPA